MLRVAFVLVAVLAAKAALAMSPAEESRSLYERLVTAQNARDIAKVRDLLIDDPDFLWVSDGKSFWGREMMLERMASFQESPVWRVTPDLASARAVQVGADAAFLHLPLELAIGPAEKPDRLPFLVSMLCRSTPQGWKIAALFTTTEKKS